MRLAVRMLFLRIVVRLIRIAKYFGDSGRVVFSVLYNLSLYRMDLSRPNVIQADFLCLYFFSLTVLYGICLFFAHCITSCRIS